MASAAQALEPQTARLLSVDAFRGFTMIMMLSEGFALGWSQFEHVSWNMTLPRDMHFWDLIQPFFMFIVGLVMPMSFSRRWAKGETWMQSLRHVLRRSAALILLGLLARSVQANRPVLDLINVLAQIAFTYLVAFLVLRAGWKAQLGVALGLLAAHWALYQFVTAPGVAGPWVRDANIGWWLDRAILHKNWGGSYATINCLSSAANTVCGVIAGNLLAAGKWRTILISGAIAMAAGLAISPVIPLNKKIWTASFALYSLGWTAFALLAFHWIFDHKRLRPFGSTLLFAVGANSILIYMLHEMLHRDLLTHAKGLLGNPMPAAWLVLAIELWFCVWLYQRKIFVKV